MLSVRNTALGSGYRFLSDFDRSERAAIVRFPFLYYVQYDIEVDEDHQPANIRVNHKQRVVEGLRLERPFRQHTFKLYQGALPIQVDLAQIVDDEVTMVIKPFYFDLTSKEGLWDHADKWIPKLERLTRAGDLPERTLLPLDHSQGKQT